MKQTYDEEYKDYLSSKYDQVRYELPQLINGLKKEARAFSKDLNNLIQEIAEFIRAVDPVRIVYAIYLHHVNYSNSINTLI